MFSFIQLQVRSSVQFTPSETILEAAASTIANSATQDISVIRRALLIRKISPANRAIIALDRVCLRENVLQEECLLKIIWLLAPTIACRALLDATAPNRSANSSILTELNVLWDTSVPAELESR